MQRMRWLRHDWLRQGLQAPRRAEELYHARMPNLSTTLWQAGTWLPTTKGDPQRVLDLHVRKPKSSGRVHFTKVQLLRFPVWNQSTPEEETRGHLRARRPSKRKRRQMKNEERVKIISENFSPKPIKWHRIGDNYFGRVERLVFFSYNQDGDDYLLESTLPGFSLSSKHRTQGACQFEAKKLFSEFIHYITQPGKPPFGRGSGSST